MPGESDGAQVPWKTLYIAAGLTVAGLALFVSGLTLWRTEGSTALIALWILGLLVFIHGFYFLRIAYLVWKGRRGYSWDDIPEFAT